MAAAIPEEEEEACEEAALLAGSQGSDLGTAFAGELLERLNIPSPRGRQRSSGGASVWP